MSMTTPKESQIQRAILDYLEQRGILHWRCNLGGVIVRQGSKLRYAKNPMKGFPDIAGILPGAAGKMFAVEVKAGKGRLSPEQEVWGARLRAHGVLHVVARSVEEVGAALKTYQDTASGVAEMPLPSMYLCSGCGRVGAA